MTSVTDNNSDYMSMDGFRAMNQLPEIGYKDEPHYKVPPKPKPISTFKESSFAFTTVSPSKMQLPPPLPPLPPSPMSLPRAFSFSSPKSPNFRPTLLSVKPPQVPTRFVQQDDVFTADNVTKVKSKNDISTRWKMPEQADTTTRDRDEDVRKALNELSDLIDSTTEEMLTLMPPPSPSQALPPPPPPPSPSYTSDWRLSSYLVPGYVQPISNEWNDINHKLNMLMINVRAQNKKIDDIRRVCVDKSDYVSFDDLDEMLTPSSTSPDFDSAQSLPQPPAKHSTLQYSVTSCKNTSSRTGRSWGRKLISCVKFGKK